jgi:hypothetical protein
VPEAKQKCLPSLTGVAPVFDHEAERRPAFVETAVFDRAELVKPGGHQDRCADHPAIGDQPVRLANAGKDRPSSEMRGETKRCPDGEIANDHERYPRSPIGAACRQPPENVEQRQYRGQHHCRQHQHSAGNDKQSGERCAACTGG